MLKHAGCNEFGDNFASLLQLQTNGGPSGVGLHSIGVDSVTGANPRGLTASSAVQETVEEELLQVPAC